ncbi:hypothetical protein Tco_1426103, partial [Tanacetum coccineum]
DEAVEKVVEFMDSYFISQENLDSMMAMSKFQGFSDPKTTRFRLFVTFSITVSVLPIAISVGVLFWFLPRKPHTLAIVSTVFLQTLTTLNPKNYKTYILPTVRRSNMTNDNPPPTPALTLSDKLMAMNHLTAFVPKKLNVNAMNYSSWVYYFSHLCHGYGILDHLVDPVASSSTTTSTDPPPKDAE